MSFVASPPSSLSATPLLHLLSATNPDQVDQILLDTFRCRHEGLSDTKAAKWGSMLNKNKEEIKELYLSVLSLIRLFIFHSLDSKESISSLFPSTFHSSLISLLTRLLLSHTQEWKDHVTNSSFLISPPKLLDVNWRVDQRLSSNQLTHLSTPTILIELTLQKQPVHSTDMIETQSVQCELSKQALSTMLSGLEKIREQLSGMQ